MLRIIRFSRRLRQTLLLVMLSVLVWISGLFVVWVDIHVFREYGEKMQRYEQNILPVNNVVERASNELVKNIRQNTEFLANTAQR